MTQSSRHTPCAVSFTQACRRHTECAGYLRRGKSLVEILVVITLMSGALGICALTLAALFRTETQLRKDREQQIIASRLSDRWRADAHSALACAVDKECVFTLPGGREAKYSIDGSTIRREVVEGAATVHRDAFPLPKNAVPAFAVSNREGRDFAVLQVQPSEPDQPPSTPIRTAVIEAVVNLHGAPASSEASP